MGYNLSRRPLGKSAKCFSCMIISAISNYVPSITCMFLLNFREVCAGRSAHEFRIPTICDGEIVFSALNWLTHIDRENYMGRSAYAYAPYDFKIYS